MGLKTRGARVFAAAAVLVALALLAGRAGAAPRVGTTCFGQPATIVGTDGDDVLRGTPGNDVIVAGDGSDIVLASGGDDLVCGEGGDDFLFGQDGNDQLDGGTGQDAYVPGLGDDKIVDSDGDSLIGFLDATGPVTASLVTGTATGGAGNDTFLGAASSLVGGPFNDTLTGDASDFNALAGGPGDDVIDGGPGFDGMLFATGPSTASLLTGTATGGDGNDTLRNMEGLEGTDQDDNFTGDNGTNVLDGRGGNDVLNGMGGTDLLQGDAQVDKNPGNDTLNGGAGDDFLQPSPGTDTIDGGTGRQDLIDFTPMQGGVSANLATGKLTGPGIGNVSVKNVEGLSGSGFDDTLVGDKGPNYIFGSLGNDHLLGAAGDDFLSGGGQTDTFDGGPGTDYCLEARGKGCEFSGTPTGSARTASVDAARLEALDTAASRLVTLESRGAVRPAAPLGVRAGADSTQLGVATCTGSTSRVTRRIAGAGAEKRRTAGGPPHKAPVTKGTQKVQAGLADLVPAWLRGPLDTARVDASQVRWQGTLFRYDAKRKAWKTYKKTAVAFGTVDPSGAALWTTASGTPVDQFTMTVPAGRFAWKGTLTVPGSPATTDWIEPHSDFARKGGGIFAPQCTFS
jgi:Ca2+-binding RTX toxin-like protein